MKKFWCVDTKFYDNGSVKVLTYGVQADKKPQNINMRTGFYDWYCDYFNTYKEAKAFAAEAERA